MALAESPLRSVQRKLYALKEIVRCKIDGFKLSYRHQGGAWVTLWAWSDSEENMPRNASGLIVEPERRVFRIPTQSANANDGTDAFAGDISENDEIMWPESALVYVVKGPWPCEHFEAVFSVYAESSQIRRAGP